MTNYSGSMLPAALLSATLLCVPAVGAAQSVANDSSTSVTAGDAGLQEVIVTAERREEPLNRVPISVTALSADQLQAINAVDFQSYADSVPGLSYTYIGPLGYYGERTYALRGISGTNTVGFYIDDSPVPIIDPKLIDIDRIEVLRGPQATLYGSNSVGGTIKVVTAQPDSTHFSGRVEGDASSTDGSDSANSRIAAMANVPLIDGILGARISVSRIENSGFINNYFDGYPGLVNNTIPPYGLIYHGVDRSSNSEEAETERIALRFTPNDQLTITASLMSSSDRIDGNDFYFSNLPNFSVQHFIPTPESEIFNLWTLSAVYKIDSVSIINTTTYFYRNYTGMQDVTQIFPIAGYATPTPVALTTNNTDRIFTDELRAQTDFQGPLNGLLGVQYSKYPRHEYDGSPVPGFNAFNPTLPPLAEEQLYIGEGIVTTVEKDAYAELRVKPVPRLELTAGARYYEFDIDNLNTSAGLLGGGGSYEATSESGVRPRATVSFQITDEIMIFTNYAKGFRPGGTNQSLPSTCTNNEGQFQGGGYKSDDVSSYDAGAKATLLDRRMQIDVSAFSMKWAGIQQQVLLPCGFNVTANTGQATSKGVELEGQIRPISSLTLDFQATNTHTNLDTAQPGNYALAGDPILNIPSWKWGVGARYDRPLTMRWSGFARADYDYVGSALLNYGDRPEVQPFVRAAYETLGLHLGVEDLKWRTELYASNLTNAHPVMNTYTFATPVNTSEYSTIRPRTIGLNASYKF